MKKVVYRIKFYLQLLCGAGYLKHSNDNIHKSNDNYTNYNLIEIYINRLITTTQIFIAMDYLIMMSEKYLYFRKTKKTHFGKKIFYPPQSSNCIHVLWEYFSNYVFTKDMYKNLNEMGIIQDVSKLIIVVNLSFEASQLSALIKYWNDETLSTVSIVLCEKHSCSAKHILIYIF